MVERRLGRPTRALEGGAINAGGRLRRRLVRLTGNTATAAGKAGERQRDAGAPARRPRRGPAGTGLGRRNPTEGRIWSERQRGRRSLDAVAGLAAGVAGCGGRRSGGARSTLQDERCSMQRRSSGWHPWRRSTWEREGVERGEAEEGKQREGEQEKDGRRRHGDLGAVAACRRS